MGVPAQFSDSKFFDSFFISPILMVLNRELWLGVRAQVCDSKIFPLIPPLKGLNYFHIENYGCQKTEKTRIKTKVSSIIINVCST